MNDTPSCYEHREDGTIAVQCRYDERNVTERSLRAALDEARAEARRLRAEVSKVAKRARRHRDNAAKTIGYMQQRIARLGHNAESEAAYVEQLKAAGRSAMRERDEAVAELAKWSCEVEHEFHAVTDTVNWNKAYKAPPFKATVTVTTGSGTRIRFTATSMDVTTE